MSGAKKGLKTIKKMISYSADKTTGRNWRPPKEDEIVYIFNFMIQIFASC